VVWVIRGRTLRFIAGMGLVCVLAGCASSGSSEESESQAPPAAVAPTVSLDAAASSVTSGSTTTLNWSSTNATGCTASGAWSGSKGTSGSEATAALTADATYSLNCSGAGGSASDSVTVAVSATAPPPPPPPPTAPTLSLTANPTSVATNASATLTWTSTNATSCTASGGWTGSKATSGSQSTGALTSTATFTLQCTGAGGSISKSATVTVTAAPPPPAAPTVDLSATPTSVNSGGSTQLSWTTANATSCTASGGWTGSKATSGNQSITGITANTTFTLQCTGTGGNAQDSVSVTVNSGSNAALSGHVDSSLVNGLGQNRVYVWQGDVTPDDYDGDAGDPVASIPVNQEENACTYAFSLSSLAPGTYTIAFTPDGASDVAGQQNTLQFAGRKVITMGSSPMTSDFAAANVIRVGPTRAFTTVRAANAAAQDGDVIEIDAGTYTDDVSVWRQDNVTLRGVGGRAHMHGTLVIPFSSGDDQRNGKGLWVLQGTGIRVENVEFSGARVSDENGAGIRQEGRNVTICKSYFHDNENGILGGAYGTLTIEYSEFANNGHGDIGRTHNIYVDEGDKLVFRHNYSHHAHIGHTLKTRAAENHILYNRIMDETDGDSSYIIDVPNGGLTFVIGNLLQQGTQTDNSTIVNYGAEGLSSGRTHEFYLINNTIVNDLGSGAFVDTASGTSVFRSVNNLFVGGGTLYAGKSPQATTNLQTTSPMFVDIDAFDYRLTSGSPAINGGSNPGSAGGVSLAPLYQYVHPTKRAPRTSNGTIDIGAYEF
jgi:hypothetical protein